MEVVLSILIVCISCVIVIRSFMKDTSHDLSIKWGRFEFLIHKHDNPE